MQSGPARSPVAATGGTVASPPDDGVQVLRLEDVPAQVVHAPDRGFNHMISRPLVDSDTLRSACVHVGHSTFAARGEGHHPLHRHVAAGQFVCVLGGRGEHIGEDVDIPLEPGDLVSIPPGEWHGFRSVGDEPAELIYGYLGVGSAAAAGLELRHDPTRAGAA